MFSWIFFFLHVLSHVLRLSHCVPMCSCIGPISEYNLYCYFKGDAGNSFKQIIKKGFSFLYFVSLRFFRFKKIVTLIAKTMYPESNVLIEAHLPKSGSFSVPQK